ncbi:hypothetical protein Syun_022778 [Stephania yunnanensis]|uniref:Uncharacterized protein n=1 Tax=Stephania yunnanensis TaxID=152371 RepID=A0AAP0I1S2_9MAGN
MTVREGAPARQVRREVGAAELTGGELAEAGRTMHGCAGDATHRWETTRLVRRRPADAVAEAWTVSSSEPVVVVGVAEARAARLQQRRRTSSSSAAAATRKSGGGAAVTPTVKRLRRAGGSDAGSGATAMRRRQRNCVEQRRGGVLPGRLIPDKTPTVDKASRLR